MDAEDLMTIGRFARLSGVSSHALRHYDEVGLLTPAHVDPDSGYRRYRVGQVRQARLIRALRWVDLPIEEIRRVVGDPDSEATRSVLAQHRERLARQRSRIGSQIEDVSAFLQRGITVPDIDTACRPVQIKLGVENHRASTAFYQGVLDLPLQVARRTESADFSTFVFGTYGQDDFFLLWLVEDPDRLDRPPGPSTIGFLVDDVDHRHERALEAGATEAVPPHDAEGMPRHSAVHDPSGNWVEFFAGGAACRPVQVRLAVENLQRAVDFYRAAFGLQYRVSRQTAEQDFSAFRFGTVGTDDFFLLWLLDDPERLDRPGPSNLSFLVDDLDAVHRRALDAGATEAVAPRDAEGMPRGSAVRDPSGNWIGLAQA